MRDKAIHLLLPFTLLLHYILAFYTIYYSIKFYLWVFSLPWFIVLIILFFSLLFLIKLVSGFFTFITLFTLTKLYKNSWLSSILYTIVGITSVILIFNHINIILNGDLNFSTFWTISKFKTIVLFIPFLAQLFIIINTMCFMPINIKLKIEKEKKIQLFEDTFINSKTDN